MHGGTILRGRVPLLDDVVDVRVAEHGGLGLHALDDVVPGRIL